MKYAITAEHGRIYIECLNGRLGTLGRRLVAVDGESVLRLADRLQARGHIEFKTVYRGRVVDERVLKAIQESDSYDASALSIHAESRWDVASLAGFAKVLLERPGVALLRRAG